MLAKTVRLLLFAGSIFLTWSVYRYFLHFPEWTDELVFKPLILLFPIFFAVSSIEKKSMKTIGLSGKNFAVSLLFGLATGLFLSLEVLVVNILKHTQPFSQTIALSPVSLGTSIGISFLTAISEETVYRGYFLTRFAKVFQNTLWANALSAMLFSLLHIPLFLFANHYSLSTLLLSLFLLFMLGFANGLLFLFTKTLTAPIASHMVWNIFSSF